MMRCEPYEMDFGDREYEAWLREHLTAAEFVERRIAFDRWAKWHGRVHRVLGPLFTLPLVWRLDAWVERVERAILAPVYRPVKRWDALAEERGGPAPGLPWKVRTEWGE